MTRSEDTLAAGHRVQMSSRSLTQTINSSRSARRGTNQQCTSNETGCNCSLPSYEALHQMFTSVDARSCQLVATLAQYLCNVLATLTF